MIAFHSTEFFDNPILFRSIQKKRRCCHGYSVEVDDQSNVKLKHIPHNFLPPNGSIQKQSICTVLEHKPAIW